MKKDLRFQKTHNAIQDAFRTLMMKKDYEKITVKELCELAKINRKTFYLHYHTLDDLIETLERELAESILLVLRETPEKITSFEVGEICKVMNEAIGINYELQMKVLGSTKHRHSIEKAQSIILDAFMPELMRITKMNASDLKVMGIGISNGINSLYHMNYQQNLGLSMDQIANLADKFVSFQQCSPE
ncbi:MAG: hypothetical protein PWP51_272 [Clostridiales bacterium]|jgi:AcrR family transcriptional regulator|nr:hypothetical protein [Clostridiales bacterium]MDN5297719.1 hypothetical protein [Clostridiales bacterium]